MPISSGAAGRVGVGVDTSIAWTPSGVKQESKPSYRNYDSYLKRYLEAHPEIRQRCLDTNSEEVTDQSCSPVLAMESESDNCKELSTAIISQQLCGTSNEEANSALPSPQTSSRSSICAIL